MSEFYRSFEDKHRGSRQLILDRLKVYSPFLEQLKACWDLPVTDLGCGRGEWLELLTSMQIRCHGVDLDEEMLTACKERGFSVTQSDAIAYLRQLGDASQMAISAFHLVEHIPFDQLNALVEEAKRVLVPGGLLILETPNPENMIVGTSSFYMDPTHVNPLPPLLLQFIPDFHGFARSKVLRLQEPEPIQGVPSVTLMHVLKGVSPDYSVVAQTTTSSGPTPDLDALFAKEFGVTLDAVASAYEARVAGIETVNATQQTTLSSVEAYLASVEATAARAAENLNEIVGALKGDLEALQRSHKIQLNAVHLELRTLREEHSKVSLELASQERLIHKAAVDTANLHKHVVHLDHHLDITRGRLHALSVILPGSVVNTVRYALLQRQLLKRDGVKIRSKLMARKVIFYAIRKASPYKPVKSVGIAVLKKIGAYEFLRSRYHKKEIPIFRSTIDPTIPIDTENLSPHARAVLAKIKLAEKTRDRIE